MALGAIRTEHHRPLGGDAVSFDGLEGWSRVVDICKRASQLRPGLEEIRVELDRSLVVWDAGVEHLRIAGADVRRDLFALQELVVRLEVLRRTRRETLLRRRRERAGQILG